MASLEKRERMRVLLERWQRRGQSAAAFCRRHGINPPKLSHWKPRGGHVATHSDPSGAGSLTP
jgi:hypothetical protein